MDAIIFDIDGTLADITHRLHHIQGEKKDYDAFYAACVDDKPKQDIVSLLNKLTPFDDEHSLIFCSGRPDSVREETVAWIYKHTGCYPRNLYMRKTGDHRPDYAVKEEILKELQAKGYNILFTVDDRQQVVDMWRRNGITCLQCDQWDEKPKKRFASGKLVLMVGPSGAGKSSLVNDWSWSHNNLNDITFPFTYGVVVSTDGIRQTFCGDFRDQSQNDRVWSYAHSLIKANIEHDINTVLDATNLRNRDRRAILSLVPDDTEITYVVVDRPLEVKLASRDWRSEDLIRRHDQLFKSNLNAILAGDDDPRVTVMDVRGK